MCRNIYLCVHCKQRININFVEVFPSYTYLDHLPGCILHIYNKGLLVVIINIYNLEIFLFYTLVKKNKILHVLPSIP